MTELSLFFKSSSRAAWLTLLALSVVSACSNTAILLLVNRRVSGGDVSSSATVAYMFACNCPAIVRTIPRRLFVD